MNDPFLEFYLDIASVVLNTASWILDRYIAALEWIGRQVDRPV